MLSDLVWSLTIFVCSLVSLRSPYIALYTVIFFDILKPQSLSYGFLANSSLSLVLTSILLFSMIINFKFLVFPRRFGITFLLIVFIVWITYTTSIAQFPGPAWFKFDYVVKTIIMTLAIPFILNSRLKVEILLCAIAAGVSYYIVIGGIRTALGQGGYGMPLVSTRLGDSGIAETSTLSMVAVFTIPIIIYIRNESLFRDQVPLLKKISIFLIICCFLTVVGTYARTGLVGLAVLGVLFFISTQYKLRMAVVTIILATSLFFVASDNYVSRMQTIENPTEEGSALGRILVWKWTIDYASQNPISGGGFDSYIANAGQLHKYVLDTSDINVANNPPKAFHNIFFEVLGEQGYVGLVIYILLIFRAWHLSWRLSRDATASPSFRSMAKVIHHVIIIYCVCGMFIGVAYAPWIFYFIGISSGLQNAFLIAKTKSKKIV